jgi:hypothetical protein
MGFMNEKDDKDGYINWLSDKTMLPSVVPDSRIISYSWSAYYRGEDVTKKRFISEADNLLTRLHDDRESKVRSNTTWCRAWFADFAKGRLKRPIIFVCSCFGGLLLAKVTVIQTHMCRS